MAVVLIGVKRPAALVSQRMRDLSHFFRRDGRRALCGEDVGPVQQPG